MRSMKHSIKREQSHARMSFAECENVRATLKHMKLSFHLILTIIPSHPHPRRDAHDGADGDGSNNG